MNVLVVAAHGLGCHWLGPYGNVWVSTPAADALAAEAVVFDHHFADDPSPAGFLRACPPTAVRALRSAGVTTALVDDRKDRSADAREWDFRVPTAPADHRTPADGLFAAIRNALDRLGDRSRWLLWIETDRLVPPWDFELETYQHYAATSGGFAEEAESSSHADVEPTDEPATGPVDVDDDVLWHRLHNSFAAAVTAFDGELGRLGAELHARGLGESAAWVVTSGFGWPLGEHGVVGPAGSPLHEELVHVPLILRLPAHRQGLRRVPAFTHTADLAPTLLDLFGVPRPADGPTTSLLPLTAGRSPTWRDVARSEHDGERAIRTADWAFLAARGDRPARLYRKPDDIWEVNDLAARHPDECDQLAARLDRPEEPTT
jgi:arylsulfatase A-like enzyme